MAYFKNSIMGSCRNIFSDHLYFRKALLVCCFSLAVFFGHASPTDSVASKWPGFVIKSDLTRYIWSRITHTQAYSITFEVLVQKHFSIQFTAINAFENSSKKGTINGATYKKKLYKDIFDFKYFITQNKPHTGIYIGVYLKYLFVKSQYSLVDPAPLSGVQSMQRFAIGGITGFQLYAKNNLSFDLVIGLGMTRLLNYNSGNQNYTYFLGVNRNKLYPDIRFTLLNIGYKF
jgi:hypothetical protein